MLVVKVEFWPGGDAARAEELGRVGIAQVSSRRDEGTDDGIDGPAGGEVCDYAAVVWDDARRTTSVHVTGHRRADRFWPLVAAVARARSAEAGGRDEGPHAAPAGREWRDVVEQIADRMWDDRPEADPLATADGAPAPTADGA